MNVDTGQILAEVFVDVLERIAFMFGDIVDFNEIPEIEAACVHAEVSFKGEINGKVEIIAPLDFCTRLAANVLGIDPDDEAAERRGIDSLRELLNITCGNFLSTIAGNKPVFSVGVPSTRIVPTFDWDTLTRRGGWMSILVDENPVLMRISIGE